ncbi:unnamed protein product, partial [Rotaria sp. Silwood2]
NARWIQDGVTVAGGHGEGDATNQLYWPRGLFIDDDQTIVIADYVNNRIIQWNMDDTNGQVVTGGNGQGNRLDQFYCPTDLLIEKKRRIVSLYVIAGMNESSDGLVIVAQHMEKSSSTTSLVSDWPWMIRGDNNGTIVAGGNGTGVGLNQLNGPGYILVDQQQTVYMSDLYNDRVMKWNKGAREGIVVVGDEGQGNALTQLSSPNGLFVDTLGTIFVADSMNARVMRWPKGAKQGTVIVGGNGEGTEANQFYKLRGLSFDRQGNLYVVDRLNNCVQRCSIE